MLNKHNMYQHNMDQHNMDQHNMDQHNMDQCQGCSTIIFYKLKNNE